MPDIPDRDAQEKELARRLARLFSAFSGHLLETLEDVSFNVSDIPEAVWKELTASEIAVLLPFLEKLALASADLLIREVPIGIEWGLAHQAAADWARRY